MYYVHMINREHDHSVLYKVIYNFFPPLVTQLVRFNVQGICWCVPVLNAGKKHCIVDSQDIFLSISNDPIRHDLTMKCRLLAHIFSGQKLKTEASASQGWPALTSFGNTSLAHCQT
jgi:hypothetical protein